MNRSYMSLMHMRLMHVYRAKNAIKATKRTHHEFTNDDLSFDSIPHPTPYPY